MKKLSLICLVLCLILLLAPMGVAVNAEGEAGSFENPIKVDGIPFDSGDVAIEALAEETPGVYYQYTVELAQTLQVKTNSDAAHVSIYKNGSETENIVGQGGEPFDVAVGDKLVFNLWAITAGVYQFSVTEKEAEPGSTPDTAQEIESLGGSYGTAKVSVDGHDVSYHKWTPLRNAVVKLSFVTNSYDGKYFSSQLYANGEGFFAAPLIMEVTAGEPVIISTETGAGWFLDGTATIKIEEAEVVKMDKSYNGYYTVGSKYLKLDYAGKTISIFDNATSNNISGVYTFTVGSQGFLKNDVVSLVAVNGENGVEILFNGRMDNVLSVWEEPVLNNQEILIYLTGTYELYHPTTGALYKTYSFDYENKMVTVTTAATGAQTSSTFELCPVDGTITISGDSSKYKIYLYDSAPFKKGDITMGNTTMTYVASHDYQATVIAPTCTEQGYTKYTCSKCGDEYIDEDSYVYPLGHDYAVTVVEPTCTNVGYTYHDCSRCYSSYRDEEVAALGHDWAEATCEAPKTCANCAATEGEALGHDWNEATCTEPKTCKVCQATEGEALNHDWADADCTTAKTCKRCDVTEGAALGHDMQPATCTKASACSRCDKTEGQPTEHNWDEGVVTKEATEEEDGERLQTCQDCGTTRTQLIPAKGHEHKYTDEVVAPTCTSKGYTTHTCGCGESYRDSEVAALDHDWKAADCTTAKTCKRCGEKEGAIPGHKWQNATCTTPKTCEVCGKTEGGTLNHNWNAATCTTPKTCKDCGKTEGTVADHKWNAATCTAPKTCSECEKTEGKALGHSMSEATCTAPATCSRCGHTQGNMLPHSYDGGRQSAGKITYTCTVCGHSYQENANAVAITVPGALTGTFNGTQDYTWTADKTGYLTVDEGAATLLRARITAVLINGEQVEKEALGYPVSAGDVVVITVETTSEVEINIPVSLKIYDGDAPMSFDAAFSGSKDFDELWTAPFAGQFTFIISKVDLDNNGLLDNVTFRIIDNGGDSSGNMYNHYDDAFGIDADGNHYITLEVEKGEILRLLVMADDYKTSGTLTITVKQGAPSVHVHTNDEGVRTEPTCVKNGYITYTCTVCGEQTMEKLNKLGHTEEVVGGKAPTCTEPGLTDGSKCSVCGEIITAQTEIAALAHTYGEWVTTKEPTATEDGVETRTCTACGAEETAPIPATGETSTEPETQPTEPETQPTEPETQPTEPETQPTEPETQPTEPETQPTEPGTEPTTKPATKPATQPGGNSGNEGGNNAVIIAIVAVVLVAGAIVAFVVIKKKK